MKPVSCSSGPVGGGSVPIVKKRKEQKKRSHNHLPHLVGSLKQIQAFSGKFCFCHRWTDEGTGSELSLDW